MPVATRQAAFTDFLSGLSLREIADKHGIHQRTAERWSSTEHWNIIRHRHWMDAQERIVKARLSEVLANDRSVTRRLHLILHDALAEQEAIRKNLKPAKFARYDLRLIIQLAKAVSIVGAAEEAKLLDERLSAKYSSTISALEEVTQFTPAPSTI